MILEIFLSLILILEFIYYFLIINKKEEKIEYYREIPSNELPAIVGLMVKKNVDGNDIISTVLDLWHRGFIDIKTEYINEEEKSVLYEIQKDRFLVLNDYENFLMDELFKNDSKVVFDDFVSSPNFEYTFKAIGNMISKRVDINSTHNVSKVRLGNKINFITNYFVLGFSILFPLIYFINNDFLISIISSYLIILVLFLLIKNVFLKSKNIELVLISYSTIISIVYFGILSLTFFISNYNYEIDLYIDILNMIISFIVIINLFTNNKKEKISLIDYLIIIYSILSICLLNVIGICLSIIYFSHESYQNAPEHVNIKNKTELDKWIALKSFLNDFTLINERGMDETKTWDRYLIYAISMGVNKEVINEYSKLLNIKLINKSILDKCYTENINY